MTTEREQTGLIWYWDEEHGIEKEVYSTNSTFFDEPRKGVWDKPGTGKVPCLVIGKDNPITKQNSLFFWIVLPDGVCGVHHSRLKVL